MLSTKQNNLLVHNTHFNVTEFCAAYRFFSTVAIFIGCVLLFTVTYYIRTIRGLFSILKIMQYIKNISVSMRERGRERERFYHGVASEL